MTFNEQSFREHLDWWDKETKRILSDIDDLRDSDSKRLYLCFFRFVLESLEFVASYNQPERLNPEDADNSVCDSLNTANK